MPEQSVFLSGMAKIESWYNKRKLSDEQLGTWFEAIGHIPNEPFNQIVKDIIDGEKFFPTPETFKTKWFDWMRSNSHRMIWDKVDCPECNGVGSIDYWVYDNGVYYAYCCGCAKCENWKTEFPTTGKDVPMLMTKDQIRASGWFLEDPHKKPTTGSEPVETVTEAVDRAVNASF